MNFRGFEGVLFEMKTASFRSLSLYTTITKMRSLSCVVKKFPGIFSKFSAKVKNKQFHLNCAEYFGERIEFGKSIED